MKKQTLIINHLQDENYSITDTNNVEVLEAASKGTIKAFVENPDNKEKYTFEVSFLTDKNNNPIKEGANVKKDKFSTARLEAAEAEKIAAAEAEKVKAARLEKQNELNKSFAPVKKIAPVKKVVARNAKTGKNK